jgi:ParB family chromosome partitioning protein
MQTSNTPPKGAAIFTAAVLARNTDLLTHHNGLTTAATLLGPDDAQVVATLVDKLLPASGDERAQVLTLAWCWGR